MFRYVSLVNTYGRFAASWKDRSVPPRLTKHVCRTVIVATLLVSKIAADARFRRKLSR